MENWMTAAEISSSYMVGEERLMAFGLRGNLAFQRTPSGAMLFDERAVARIFRPRGAAVRSFAAPSGPNLGVLGFARLGDASTRRDLPKPELGPREARARALRLRPLEHALTQTRKAG